MSEISILANDESATQALAARLAGVCAAGDCLLLQGDLGAGKTTFARGFIGALQAAPEEVLSPTFSLVQSYMSKGGYEIFHFDLYRLKSPSDLVEIGFDEAVSDGLTLVEWPDIAGAALPKNALTIRISFGENGARNFLFSGEENTWNQRLQKLKVEP
ncbi:MAG: tRNA (adenosine(37)-N6)-threonylcarbamoyltransferase complex ATPase subunit type 1 TsaE [Alphaproteobacteria bacterium]|nr:tRNA (adenosine(37)-N6)-threonylcarbamoyltransferase complex ATPase subunit type 1 TsaE [Alphaproteobacteria bacterium]